MNPIHQYGLPESVAILQHSAQWRNPCVCDAPTGASPERESLRQLSGA